MYMYMNMIFMIYECMYMNVYEYKFFTLIITYHKCEKILSSFSSLQSSCPAVGILLEQVVHALDDCLY